MRAESDKCDGISLAGLVSELNKKVNDIPTLDIKTTYDTLSSLSKSLDGVVADVVSTRQSQDSQDMSIDSALNHGLVRGGFVDVVCAPARIAVSSRSAVKRMDMAS